MAYKFQLGAAILSGSLIQEGNVQAGAFNISGSDLYSDQNLTSNNDIVINNGDFTGSNTNQDGFDIKAMVANSGSARLSASAGQTHTLIEIKNNAGNDALKIGSSQEGSNLGEGFISSHNASGVKQLYLSGASGNGSVVTLSVGGTATIGGGMLVQGNLDVNGTQTILNSSNLIIDDGEIQINATASSLANSYDSGFKMGGTAGGAQLLFKSGSAYSDATEDSVFAIVGEVDSNDFDVTVSAGKLYGSGAGLTGIGGAPTFAPAAKINGNTLELNKINYVTSDVAAVTLTLPSAADGAVLKVKSYGNHNENEYIQINRAGSDTIDGATSIRLESAYSSVTLMASGSSWFVL